jgi:RHS repeat-associated protein
MSSKTVTLAGTTYSSSSTPANGDWTLTTTTPDGQSSVQTYTSGRLAKTETFDNQTTPVLIASVSYTYDDLGRTTTTTDSRTGVTTTAYLSTTADVPTSVTDPGSRTTAYTYDTRGRTIAVDAPDTTVVENGSNVTLANITHTSYNPTGTVAGTWGDQTYARLNVYDDQNRLVELRTFQDLAHGTEPTIATTGFASTKWNYNPSRGWLDNKRYDDDKGTDYTYTSAGRLKTRTWARGVTTIYSYDQGQMVSTDYSDSTPDVVYTYDNFGRPTLVTQAEGIINGSNVTLANQHAYLYDPATLVLDKETISYGNGLSRTLDRSQDNLLRPSGFQLMNGTTEEHATSYGYDVAGRLAGVHSGSTYPATPDFSYNYLADSGSLVQSVTGPAHTVSNTYEATRNVLDTKANETNGSNVTLVSQFDYSVNALGQRDDVSRSGSAFASANTETWNYNAKGEVETADHSTNNAFDRSFQFDGIGNRKKSANSLTLPATDNYTSNALNQYSAVGVAARVHDQDGNLTDDGTKLFIWDAENRLIEVQNKIDSSTVATYAYDYQSRRISKTIGSAITSFVYNGWNPIAEFSGTTLSKSYAWGMDVSGSMQGAGGVGGLLSVNDGSATYYPTYDGNGNISEYVDNTGVVVAHYEYDAFGQAVASGAKANDFSHQFSTKHLDSETGLNYYGYRYYDASIGRWLGRDPIEESGGLNIYMFVYNDPNSYVDDLGNTPKGTVNGKKKARYPTGDSKAIHVQQPLPNLPTIDKGGAGASGGTADAVVSALSEAVLLGQGWLKETLVQRGLEKCKAMTAEFKRLNPDSDVCIGCCTINLVHEGGNPWVAGMTANNRLWSANFTPGRCNPTTEGSSAIYSDRWDSDLAKEMTRNGIKKGHSFKGISQDGFQMWNYNTSGKTEKSNSDKFKDRIYYVGGKPIEFRF